MRIEDPDSISKSPDGRPDSEQPVWREQFPIDWPTDDFRSRRDFTKLLGLTSLAFVVGQIWIAFLALRRRTRSAPVREVAALEELPVGGSKVFDYPSPGAACVLTRIGPDRFVAYGQKCTHLSCPVIPKPEKNCLQCPCHDGVFDLATGEPLSGPPRRPLPRLKLEVRDGRVFAAGVEYGVL
ncbi:MAG TPA: Rieske (2Fe-2S) protein [Thermoanaerobaculia bacterium]